MSRTPLSIVLLFSFFGAWVAARASGSHVGGGVICGAGWCACTRLLEMIPKGTLKFQRFSPRGHKFESCRRLVFGRVVTSAFCWRDGSRVAGSVCGLDMLLDVSLSASVGRLDTSSWQQDGVCLCIHSITVASLSMFVCTMRGTGPQSQPTEQAHGSQTVSAGVRCTARPRGTQEAHTLAL